MCPADDISGANRAYIIPIGGAEEKLNSPDILDRFVDVCGGLDARIGIIPTASELEDTGRNYEKLFRKIGVKHTRVLPFITREDCQNGVDVDYIEKCDGVFMTGGNQLRLSTTLGGTKVAQLIRRRNAEGMHVAGTSAGAAFMPEHMIAGGAEGSTPSPDMVTMAPGLGLTNAFIIDKCCVLCPPNWCGCVPKQHGGARREHRHFLKHCTCPQLKPCRCPTPNVSATYNVSHIAGSR